MSNNGQQQGTDLVVRAKGFLEARQTEIDKWAIGGVKGDALTRYAIHELRTNWGIRDATPESVYMALLSCAVTGLVPGALKQECFLVPFGRKVGDKWVNEAKFLVGWRGLTKQAMRSGHVKGIDADVVYSLDIFDIQKGSNPHVVHRPHIGPSRGEILGAWAMAQTATGHYQIEFMERDAIDEVKKFAASKTKDKNPPAPWVQWYSEMARKTVIRRLAKHLTLGDDYYHGVRIEAARFAGTEGDGESDVEVLDALTDGAASRARQDDVRSLAAPLPLPAPAPAPASVPAAASAPPADQAPPAPPARGRSRSAGKADPAPTPTNNPPPAPPAPPAPAPASAPAASTSSSSTTTGTSESGNTSAPSESPVEDADLADEPEGFDSFDEPAPDIAPVPTVNSGVGEFIDWMKSCKSRHDLHNSAKAKEWRAWLDANVPDKADPARTRVKDAFNERWKELPPDPSK